MDASRPGRRSATWVRAAAAAGLLSAEALAAPPEPLLARVVDSGGARLELAHGPGAARALLLLGPAHAYHSEGALGVDPLVAQPLVLEPVGRGRWPLPESAATPGSAAQAAVRGADGRWRYSNVAALGGSPWGPTEPADPTAQGGQVVIVEFMKDPEAVPDARGEWIELESLLPHRIDLRGWILRDDGTDLHVIDCDAGPVWLGPRARIVLGRNADPELNGGVRVDYRYSGFVLANRADAIHLHSPDGALVDSVVYDSVSWPSRPGASISYGLPRADALLNDLPASWCSSSTPLPAGDRGTPGAPNDPCP